MPQTNEDFADTSNLDLNTNKNPNKMNSSNLNKEDEDKINMKKFVVIGVAVVAIVISILATMRFVTKGGFDNSLVTELDLKDEKSIKQSNPSLFQAKLEDKKSDIQEQRSEKISNLLQGLKHGEEDEDIKTQEVKKVQKIQKPAPQRIISKDDAEAIAIKSSNLKEKIKKDKPTNIARQIPIPAKPKPLVDIRTLKVNKASSKLTKNDMPTGHYVQVGVFRLQPDNKFLGNIRSKGYDYRIYTSKFNTEDRQKVVIGPYKSKAEALEILKKVKKDIEPQAFISKL